MRYYGLRQQFPDSALTDGLSDEEEYIKGGLGLDT